MKRSESYTERNFLMMLAAVLVFFAVRSITESVAFFSADWLFVAPIIAYLQCLDGQVQSGQNAVTLKKGVRPAIKKALLFFEKYVFWPMGAIFGKKLLQELMPYDVSGFEKKVRLGNQSDGGYVLPENILPLIDVAYGYGVADHIDFEEDLIKKRDIPVRLYDHSVESLPLQHKNFYFFKQGIGHKKSGSFDTFGNQVKANGDSGKKILLKMDIEGCEWKVLGDIIQDFSQDIVGLIVEIHQLYRYEKFPQYIDILKKIDEKFTLVHIHGNNNGEMVFVNGTKITSVLELTFINNNLVTQKKAMALPLPSALDYPNMKERNDVVLDFWLRPTGNEK